MCYNPITRTHCIDCCIAVNSKAASCPLYRKSHENVIEQLCPACVGLEAVSKALVDARRQSLAKLHSTALPSWFHDASTHIEQEEWQSKRHSIELPAFFREVSSEQQEVQAPPTPVTRYAEAERKKSYFARMPPGFVIPPTSHSVATSIEHKSPGERWTWAVLLPPAPPRPSREIVSKLDWSSNPRQALSPDGLACVADFSGDIPAISTTQSLTKKDGNKKPSVTSELESIATQGNPTISVQPPSPHPIAHSGLVKDVHAPPTVSEAQPLRATASTLIPQKLVEANSKPQNHPGAKGKCYFRNPLCSFCNRGHPGGEAECWVKHPEKSHSGCQSKSNRRLSASVIADEDFSGLSTGVSAPIVLTSLDVSASARTLTPRIPTEPKAMRRIVSTAVTPTVPAVQQSNVVNNSVRLYDWNTDKYTPVTRNAQGRWRTTMPTTISKTATSVPARVASLASKASGCGSARHDAQR